MPYRCMHFACPLHHRLEQCARSMGHRGPHVLPPEIEAPPAAFWLPYREWFAHWSVPLTDECPVCRGVCQKPGGHFQGVLRG